MPLSATRSPAEMLLASLTDTMYYDAEGNLELLANNLWPNQYLVEIGEDDLPTAHQKDGVPERVEGYHVLVSRPTDPRRATMRRQNAGMLPAENAGWKSEAPWVAGPKSVPTSTRIAPVPDVDIVPASEKGFAGGNYAWAYGFSNARKQPTTTSGFRHFTLASGEVPVFPVPETFERGAHFYDIYMTERAEPGGVAITKTATLLTRLPIRSLRPGGTYTYRGGPQSLAKRPKRNETGVPVTGRPGEPRHFHEIPAQSDLAEGVWKLAVQLANGRGAGLLSPFSKPHVVRGDTERRLVEGTGTGDALAEDALAEDALAEDALYEDSGDGGSDDGGSGDGGSGDGGSEFHQAEGKRESSPYAQAGGSYAGEEVDFEEDTLLSLVNARRAEAGLPRLVTDAHLNRLAYREVDGPRMRADEARPEDYPGEYAVALFSTSRDSGEDALFGLNEEDILDRDFQAVGVAREPGRAPGIYEWAVVFGDATPDDDVDAPPVCEMVSEDGTVHRHLHREGGTCEYLETIAPDGSKDVMEEAEYRDVINSWDLVSVFEDDSARMLYTYSGSYGSTLSSAASGWNALRKVRVETATGSFTADVSITDGSLPSGVYGRTYPDGRMIGSSSVLARGTTNANQAMWAHELGHGLGFDHAYGTPSVMNTPITSNSSSNNATPTSYDRSEYQKRWGYLQDSSGPLIPSGGAGGTGGTGTNEPETNEPRYETVELGYKKKTAMLLRAPRIAKKRKDELKFSWWLAHTPLDGGDTAYYRFVPGGRRGDAYFAVRENTKDGLAVSGPLDSGGRSRIECVSEELPTEDTSVITAPDPESIPDAPGRAGLRVLDPGSYLVALQGVLEGGGLTRESEPVSVTIRENEVIRVSPTSLVNLAKNAEFARLNASGMPEDWKTYNVTSVATNFAGVAEGELTIEARSATGSAPRVECALVPVSSSSVLTVSGAIGSDALDSGSARVSLRQFDESGVYISDLTCGDIPQGQVGDIVFTRKLTGDDRNESCAFVALSPRLSGTTVKGRARFSHLKLMPFDADIRKFDAEGFDPPKTTALSAGSFIAFGEPLRPGGLAPQDPVVPLSVDSFEGGSGWGAGWSYEGERTATQLVSTTAKVYGSHGWRVYDTSSARQNGFMQRTFSGKSELAVRFLFRPQRLPSRGEIAFCALSTPNNTKTVYLTLGSKGGVQVRMYDQKTKKISATTIGTLTAGQSYDIEVQASGLGTTGGTVSVGLANFGQTRQTVFTSGARNLTGSPTERVQLGIFAATESLAQMELHFDEIVVTERGDILYRERPPAPSSYTPPPLDRPKKSGAARQFAPSGESAAQQDVIGQTYIFIAPGEATAENPAVLYPLGEEFGVKPGMTYTPAYFARYSVFEDASPGFSVMLYGAPGSTLPPLKVGSVGEMAGKSSLWSPAGRTDQDYFTTFTVPEIREGATIAGTDGRSYPDGVPDGYVRARIMAELTPGEYVIQEPLFAYGSHTTFAAREALRGYGRKTGGEAIVMLDTKPEAAELSVPRTELYVTERGVKVENSEDLPPGVSVQPYYSDSPDRLAFTEETEDPASFGPGGTDGRPERYQRIRLVFAGDGRESARVPAGGIFARTWHPDAVLLREDGTHFPGMAFVSKTLFASAYPDVSADSVGGHFYGIRESEEIGRIRDVEVSVMTEAAAREIERLSLTDELRIEVPGAGGTGAGEAYLVRMREQLLFTPEDMPPRVTGGHRRILFRASAAECEVIEVYPLAPPNPRPVVFRDSLADAPRMA